MSLTPNEYQNEAAKTAIYPKALGIDYCVLGLVNEAGEVAGKLKKHIRGDYDYQKAKELLKGELGDVLWYAANLARELNITLEDVMIANLDKLADRKVRGTLQGDGDTR